MTPQHPLHPPPTPLHLTTPTHLHTAFTTPTLQVPTPPPPPPGTSPSPGGASASDGNAAASPAGPAASPGSPTASPAGPAVSPGGVVVSPGGVVGGGQVHSMAWLRATVARFSSGPDHTRRRAHATTTLAALDPPTLRAHAHHLATTALSTAGHSLDVMPDLARRIPLTALATALADAPLPVPATDISVAAGASRSGPVTDVPVPADASRSGPVTDISVAVDASPAGPTTGISAVVAATLIAAPAYLSTVDSPVSRVAEIDRAVADLVGLLGSADGDDEATANRIALLFQAADATAGLIGNAIPAVLDPVRAADSTETVLVEVLRHDPPVRVARRVAVRDTTLAGSVVPAGTPVVLHLAEANLDTDHPVPGAVGGVWTFGDGEHRCPGAEHAVALAAGVLDAVRGGERRWRTGKVVRDPDAHPSMPSYLEIVEMEGTEG